MTVVTITTLLRKPRLKSSNSKIIELFVEILLLSGLITTHVMHSYLCGTTASTHLIDKIQVNITSCVCYDADNEINIFLPATLST